MLIYRQGVTACDGDRLANLVSGQTGEHDSAVVREKYHGVVHAVGNFNISQNTLGAIAAPHAHNRGTPWAVAQRFKIPFA